MTALWYMTHICGGIYGLGSLIFLGKTTYDLIKKESFWWVALLASIFFAGAAFLMFFIYHLAVMEGCR